MTELVLFHHALGLTDGVLAFADELRDAGHVVHSPDLYEGELFADLEEGIAHAEDVGFGKLVERGMLAVQDLPHDVVYAGMSLGVIPAELLALTRGRPAGALLLHGCVPPDELGAPWPARLPVQVHMMEDDEWVVPPNEDLDAARRLEQAAERAELFLYPGNGHLFADRSVPAYDEAAAALLMKRVLGFLDGVG